MTQIPSAPASGEPVLREIRADHDDSTIVVYQAYRDDIADPALAAGRFVAPFSHARMTWIKPSWMWMMYRCGWASKEGQERVLAVRMTRAGFESALWAGCLAHFDADVHRDHDDWLRRKADHPVRIQWDPERTATMAAEPHRRAIQVGLAPAVVLAYVDEWVVDLTDATDLARAHDTSPRERERPYPLPLDLAARIGATRPAGR